MAEGGGADSGLLVADVPEGQGKLVCIQYPGEEYTFRNYVHQNYILKGFVDNVDRAISSLGGMNTIEKAGILV